MTGEKTYAGLRFWVLFLAGLSFVDLAIMLVIITLHAAWPADVQVMVLNPLFDILSGAAGASVVLGLFWFLFRYPQHRKMLLIVMLITTGILVAHFYTINQPPTSQCFNSTTNVQGCVMDEIYYVPAAQALLSGEKCGPYLDNCNLEHPFLSKAIIAAGIVIFGNNDFGWRFFEVVLGTASIPILFAICWSLTKDSTISLFATFLLAFETLFFVHSSIAVIDVQAIFFALLAFMVYVADIRVWKLDRVTLAGILLGLAALSKETAVFLVAFLVTYNLLFGAGKKLTRFISSARMFIVVALVFIVGLQLYVTLFGNSSTTTFIDDISYILKYGASLKCTSPSCGWVDSVLHTPITPLSWVTFYSAIGYFVTRVTINNSYTYVSLGYWGISNFFEVWLTYIWAPYVVYLAYKLWTSRTALVADLTIALNIDTPSFRLARFALLWFIFAYFPYVALYFYGRVTYPYYILSAIPAISIGCAFLLTRKWFPREVAYVVLMGVFIWFFLYYPDKSFLPNQLRTILGH